MMHSTPLETGSLANFLQEVRQLTTADVHQHDAQCVVAATDNSIWQIMPCAVIAPKQLGEVKTILKLLSSQKYQSIAITPKGGGTSTAGQTLTDSVVLDLRRRLHHILEYDPVTKQVVVESGAVLHAVNTHLKQFGVKIGPTVATANRATIGGMIGNDSAGKGSLVYGKMSDCVVDIEFALASGEVIHTSHLENDVLVKQIKNICNNAKPHLKDHWPELPRFVSGYNLPMTLDGNGVNVNHLICGSEGTLGVVLTATLQCVEIPKSSSLIVAGFPSIEDALKIGASLSKLKPSAIEVVDELVLERARKDASWSSVTQALGDMPASIQSLLFIEFNHRNKEDIQQTCETIREHADHIEVLTELIDIETAWNFRSRAVGLLSASETPEKPIPFVEDCGIPPQLLPEFIASFKSLLAKHDLQAGMFGHVDAGVIHVRPALNLEQNQDRQLIHIVMQEVFALVREFDGVIWGEHGKGFRSSFCKETFGDAIWNSMCDVKKLFDPTNQLNPGKVASTNPKDSMTSLKIPMRGELDAQSTKLPQLLNSFRCDGNSECQSVDTTQGMCPTYRATNNPIHSPRGRSELLRHWQFNVDNANVEEIKDALDGCLSCRACASGCPMHVDIPTMRTTFYETYYKNHKRPLQDIAWFQFECLLPLLASPLGSLIPMRFLSRIVGIVDPPAISKPTLKQLLKREGILVSTIDEIKLSTPDVVLLLDPFTTYFRSQVILAFINILKHLHIKFALCRMQETGKAHHIRGDVERFEKIATQNMKLVQSIQGVTQSIVGIDPAATLLFRDEYMHATGTESDSPIQLPQEWLIAQDISSLQVTQPWKLLPHCIEKSMASQSANQWNDVFRLAGCNLEIIQTSCCGMGGLFGHQQEFKSQSTKIWDIHWDQHNPDENNSMVTGYSCYSQALRIRGVTLPHPLEVLANSIS